MTILLQRLAVCAPLLLAAAARAQEAPTQEGRFEAEIEVSEVLLDVLVTDRSGNVVLGLGPSDFRITEDGAPVEVTGAEFYSHRQAVGAATAAGAPPPSQPSPRYLILFFEDQRRRSVDGTGLLQRQIRAGRDAREFLERARTPGDWIAVAGYDRELRLYTDFTRDGAVLERAIDAATLGRADRGNWPSRLPEDPAVPSLARSLPAGDELQKQSGTIYEGLTLVAEAAAKLTGRKNLLLFTMGFGRVNRVGMYEPEWRYYEPMAESLNDANVAVYTFDLTPVGTIHPFADAMNQVSSDTGGRYFHDILHFATPLAQVAKETSGYYLVSYRATHPAGVRGFQLVKVSVANPELKVTARRGYRFGE